MATAEPATTASELSVEQANRLHHEFISKRANDLTGLRPIIARSWFRSRAAGVDAVVDRGHMAKGRVDEQTMQALEPHLRRLDEVAADMGGYVSITAPNGVLLKPSFLRHGESFPEGYLLLEESCGSNGEGLALEEGRGVWLAPEEHFREDMRGNWCFATLVRDPFHNRVRAVIGLTFPKEAVKGIEPSSTLLMLEGVASRVEREIESRTSLKERSILREYLATSRRNGSAFVIALDGKNTFMNSSTSESLVGSDFAITVGYAKTVMASGEAITTDVFLEGVGESTIEISPVVLSGISVGTIAVVRPHSKSKARRGDVAPRTNEFDAALSNIRPELLANFHGVSRSYVRTLELVGRALDQSRSVNIVGEVGVGKHRIAETMAGILGRSVISHDALENDDKSLSIAALSVSVRRDPAAVVIIENAHELSVPQAQELVDVMSSSPTTRLFITSTRPSDSTLLISESCDMLEIAVDPLRKRREDIPVLVRAIVAELGSPAVSDKLVSKPTNSDWPKNVDQLRLILENAVGRSSGVEIGTDDFPESFDRVLTSGRLSRLEDAELSEIRAALKETNGNRRRAADILQIGRSTLYRRIDYFQSRGIDF